VEAKMRAIVVDDSKAIRTSLSKMLGEFGFEVFSAGHGGDAIELLDRIGAPDLALVDWNMPEVDGYEFVCRVRADERYAGMRLMMVTTESELAQVQRALEAGANEYLMKPFTKDAVLEKLMILGLG
jgi:two-component system chemotaxis response regulator CheY